MYTAGFSFWFSLCSTPAFCFLRSAFFFFCSFFLCLPRCLGTQPHSRGVPVSQSDPPPRQHPEILHPGFSWPSPGNRSFVEQAQTQYQNQKFPDPAQRCTTSIVSPASEHRSSVPSLPIRLPTPILGVWLLSGPRFGVRELEVNCGTKDCRKLSLPNEKGVGFSLKFIRSLVCRCNVMI